MPFPLTHTAKVSGSCGDIATARMAIVSALKDLNAKNLVESERSITFSGGAFRFVLSNNLLVSFSTGRLTLDHDNAGKVVVEYQLRFIELVVTCTVMVFGFVGPFIFFQQDPDLNLVEKIALLTGAWCWLVGGNYVITMIRFRSFVRRLLNNLN
jgi:hypothetical protein